MEKLLIIGASGHGKVAADIASKLNTYKEIAFLDDDKSMVGTNCMGNVVLGDVQSSFGLLKEWNVFVAIGNSVSRKKVTECLLAEGANLVTLIHPNAVIGMDVKIGKGSVVMAGVVINPGSRIGAGCIINTSSSVDHDCIIGDYCHISVGAHLAGTVSIGGHTWIGAGATVSNNVVICGNCMIGAGAVVVRDINEAGTYIGFPAKKRVD